MVGGEGGKLMRGEMDKRGEWWKVRGTRGGVRWGESVGYG
jgi:hypothetical protein